jgi:hypothetical protein
MRSVPSVGVSRGWVAAPVVALDDVEPVLDVVEGLAADVVDVGAAVAGVGVAFHEAGGAEDAEVLADEWLAAPEGVGEASRSSAGRAGGWGHPSRLGCMSLWLCTAACGLPGSRTAMRPAGVWPREGGQRVCHTTGPFWTFLGCQGATVRPVCPADFLALAVPQGPRNRPSLSAGSE